MKHYRIIFILVVISLLKTARFQENTSTETSGSQPFDTDPNQNSTQNDLKNYMSACLKLICSTSFNDWCCMGKYENMKCHDGISTDRTCYYDVYHKNDNEVKRTTSWISWVVILIIIINVIVIISMKCYRRHQLKRRMRDPATMGMMLAQPNYGPQGATMQNNSNYPPNPNNGNNPAMTSNPNMGNNTDMTSNPNMDNSNSQNKL